MIVGIDLGATNSLVAAWLHDQLTPWSALALRSLKIDAEARNCLGDSDPELTVVLPENFASSPTGWSTSRSMMALFAGILLLGSVVSACLIIWGH